MKLTKVILAPVDVLTYRDKTWLKSTDNKRLSPPSVSSPHLPVEPEYTEICCLCGLLTELRTKMVSIKRPEDLLLPLLTESNNLSVWCEKKTKSIYGGNYCCATYVICGTTRMKMCLQRREKKLFEHEEWSGYRKHNFFLYSISLTSKGFVMEVRKSFLA